MVVAACGDGSVEPPVPAVLNVTPASATMVALGDTVRYSTSLLDAAGQPIPDAGVQWTTADPTVAVVDAGGLVTAVANGTTVVSATSAGISGIASVIVAQVAAQISVEPDSVTLDALGDTLRLTARAEDRNGNHVAGTTFNWSSSNASAVAINANGLVTAVDNGTATITATAAADEASGTAVVAVTQSAGSVVVSPPADTINLGDTLRLVAGAYDANGHSVTGAEFDWSSSDASVAKVDAAGLVRGQVEGRATITAASGDAQGTSEITVQNQDRAVLVALYNATDGPNWVNSDNWLTDAPLGEWYGVHTNGSGRVVRLNLRGRVERSQPVPHGLAGPIPPELANLTNMESLQLGHNELTGPIPPELGSLASLTGLGLQGNNLTGPIPPELGGLTNLRSLFLSGNALADPIPAELGGLTNLTLLHFGANSLTGAIPAELGSLIHLRSLILYYNELKGPIPPELGNLDGLRQLELGGNSLTGAIPRSLLQLSNLSHFYFQANDGLCAPGTTGFVGWLEGMGAYQGAFCNRDDRELLELLFERAGGPGWTASDQWLATDALEEWHGVAADSLGRVVTLDLTRNGLAGSLPPALGTLSEMTRLRIGGNALHGRLPLSLNDLQLAELDYGDTELCAPANASFQAWLKALPSHKGAGIGCPPLSDREILEVLYEITDGPTWLRSENWMTDAPLSEWHGVSADEQGRVVRLELPSDWLEGKIPRELGGLAKLKILDIQENRLSGSIPPELGSLADLRQLVLRANDLEGSIPAELGRLANIRNVDLSDNDLTGPIPPALGDLANLSVLSLNRNGLTGPLPSELGRLRFAGSLYLAHNNLVGPVPPEFGGITYLEDLSLSGNTGMSGVLPSSLTNLRSLNTLNTGGTGLCAPTDPSFLEWLERLPNRRVVLCDGEPAAAYLVQAVQSREFPVPLVAGDEALLRVFVTAARPNQQRLPSVRATFYLGGTQAHVADIAEKAGPIPTATNEASLAKSANAVIPGEVVQPGLEMVIEIDPDRTSAPGLGVAKRIPATGRSSVDVREVPVFNLTLIPFLRRAAPDSSILEITGGMAADPEGQELLEDVRTLLPVRELDVEAHEPVLTSANSRYGLLTETLVIQVMEGRNRYYMGMASGLSGGMALTTSTQRVSIAGADPSTIAHELGHNMWLAHAPCGNARFADPSFPYSDGSIGVWGYDFRDGGRLVPPATWDLMSYCDPAWISDYHFTKALGFRLFDEAPRAAAVFPSTRSLLLWGGIGADSVPFLEPAFVVDAPAALPDSAGEYRIAGGTDNGTELFSLAFSMPKMTDGDGSSGFAFVLPVRSGWEDTLARITLSGPAGSTTVDRGSDLPIVILRNPRTGQVRGILRDPPPETQAARDEAGRVAGQAFEVLFSRGIPEAGAWRW